MIIPTVHGKTGKIYKVVYLLNYSYGHAYLDRCGRTINSILQSAPEWMTSEIGTQGCNLISSDSGSTFNFNTGALSLTLEQNIDQDLRKDELDIFKEQAYFLTTTVVDQLNLNEFSRISVKSSIAFAADTKSESEQWLIRLKAFEIAPRFSQAFGESIESAAAAVTFIGDDRKYRVQFSLVEKQAQIDRPANPAGIRTSTLSREQNKALKNRLRDKRKGISGPIYASLIDIDAYQEEPVSIDPLDYITTSLENSISRLEKSTSL